MSPTEKNSFRTSIANYADGVTSPSGTSSQTKQFNSKYLNSYHSRGELGAKEGDNFA